MRCESNLFSVSHRNYIILKDNWRQLTRHFRDRIVVKADKQKRLVDILIRITKPPLRGMVLEEQDFADVVLFNHIAWDSIPFSCRVVIA
jgi:hypothetical protein